MSYPLILIGHTPDRKGAKNFKGEHEYDFNYRIAIKVFNYLDEQISVISKIDNWKEVLDELKPTVIIELHFNYFGGDASGCEALILKGDTPKDINELLEEISDEFTLRNRGVKPLAEGDRGYQNLVTMRKYCRHVFILEPCFQGDKEIFEDEENYALLLAHYLEKYIPLKKKYKPKQKESLWKRLLAYLSGLLQS